MEVLIINLDSKIPNLALKKIEKYHLDKGDKVYWNKLIYRYLVDKVYVSCIFVKNKPKAKEWNNFGAEVGGSGWDLKKILPPYIDRIKPRINLGFTTRGCIRNCEFCIVPEKEGKIRAVGDVYDIWDGKSKQIILLDNNILALPKHFFKIAEQIKKEKLKIDFNQGLDIRLINNENAKMLSKLQYLKQIRFSFDDIRLEKIFKKKMKILLNYFSPSKIMIYLLVGFNTSFKEDMYRLKVIRNFNCDGFVMLYNNKKDRLLREFTRWNNRFCFRNLPFKDYLKAKNYSYLLEEL